MKPHRHCERQRSNPVRGAALDCFVAALLAMTIGTAAQARDFEMGGDGNYSIMAPEPGTGHHRGTPAQRQKSTGAPQPLTQRPPRSSAYVARGSSGVVLPTPLPKTQLIPPEGGTTTLRMPLQEQGPTLLPGLNPIPNLPHGPETFQDRASRCAQQQALYGVPATSSNLYMHTCMM